MEWTTKTDKVNKNAAAHINDLQTYKLDTDGETPMTGTLQTDKGANIPSAATLEPGSDGNVFHVTGTTSITAINAARSQPGTIICLVFDGILTLTHHATDLILPGGANITTAAGDRAIFVEDSADKWICLAYIKANGEAIVTEISRDASPQLGGNLDCQEKLLQDIKAAYFKEEYPAGESGAGAKPIDFSNGHKQKVILTGNCAFSFSFPGVGNYLLRMIQDDPGGRAPTWPGANWTWTDGTEPTWATGIGEVSIVSVYYDGVDAWAGGRKFA